jgi:hypothetical protein
MIDRSNRWCMNIGSAHRLDVVILSVALLDGT